MSVSGRNSVFSGYHVDPNDALDLEKLRAMRKNKLFRRIEADIKERDRKRKPGRPEQYVDRDRIIAVTLGESDIRETMLRQRMFLTKNTNMVYEEEQSFKILLQQAEHELHRGAFDRALAYLDKAVKMVPDDPVSLLLRASCLVGVQEFDRSIKDINVVLQVSPCSRAFLIKGDALYHLGDFEHALVFYHRALARKTTTKEEEAIRFGIARAETAVDNAVGFRAEDHFMEMVAIIQRLPDSVFGLTWQELQQLGKENKAKKKPPPPNAAKNKYFPIQEPMDQKQTRGTKREKKYHRELLGELSKDLDYLEVLATEVRGTREVDLRGEKVTQEAEDAINFLKNRQDFWTQFQPMYCDQKKKQI